MTSGAAASAHLGQLTAVRQASAPSPGNRLPLLESPGRENWAAGSAVAGGKSERSCTDRPSQAALGGVGGAASGRRGGSIHGNALEGVAREDRKGSKGACASGLGPQVVCPSKSEAPPRQRGSARRAQPPGAHASHSQRAMVAGGQAGDLQGASSSTSDRGSATAVAGRVQAEVQTAAGPRAGAHGAVRRRRRSWLRKPLQSCNVLIKFPPIMSGGKRLEIFVGPAVDCLHSFVRHPTACPVEALKSTADHHQLASPAAARSPVSSMIAHAEQASAPLLSTCWWATQARQQMTGARL